MKSFTAILILSTSLTASAQTLRGAPADRLIRALSHAGVQSFPGGPGESLLEVKSLKCVTPDGSNGDDQFLSNCEFSANGNPQVKGSKADALIESLRGAKVASERALGEEAFNIKSVSCSTPDGSNGDENFVSECEVE